MVTRRELVAAGALGMMSGGVAEPFAISSATAGGEAAQTVELLAVQALKQIQGELQDLRAMLREALQGPGLAAGPVAEVRRVFNLFLRSNQKYPDYCEIGSGVFTDLYDWHVRNRQPIEVTRTDGRLAIRFMFTWMVLRTEQDPGHIGYPYDRG